ncbi:MAG: GNAT family N-acetyltransferase [Anaerolineae bacterium]|nr:GNAT family N-acetyltransferase [Anaerolineae bacterium]
MSNIFEGKLIRLRAVEPSDWEFYFNWGRETTENGRLSDEIWFPSSSVGTKEWAEKEAKRPETDEFRFHIETLIGEPVGTINSHGCNPRNGTFMYGLGIKEEQRRKGYASEAIRLVLRYFFGERRYQKCTVTVFAFNGPSQKLHEALGFTLEGRLRRMIYTGGAFHDELVYGITREEFEKQGLRAES